MEEEAAPVPVEEEAALAVTVEEEAALAVTVEEEAALVPVEEEGALVPVEEEGALAVTVEEEVALGLENMVAVVVLVAAVEEEGAVAALGVAEVWLGAPKSSPRRLLVRLLTDMARGNFLFPACFLKNFVKTFNTPGALTSTMQATKMQRARSFLYTSP